VITINWATVEHATAAVAATGALIFGFINMMVNRKHSAAIQNIHVEINHRMDQLLASKDAATVVKEELAHAAGRREGVESKDDPAAK
jgi:hypothetical protein